MFANEYTTTCCGRFENSTCFSLHSQMSHENEEAERKELQKLLSQDRQDKGSQSLQRPSSCEWIIDDSISPSSFHMGRTDPIPSFILLISGTANQHAVRPHVLELNLSETVACHHKEYFFYYDYFCYCQFCMVSKRGQSNCSVKWHYLLFPWVIIDISSWNKISFLTFIPGIYTRQLFRPFVKRSCFRVGLIDFNFGGQITHSRKYE